METVGVNSNLTIDTLIWEGGEISGPSVVAITTSLLASSSFVKMSQKESLRCTFLL